jgi:hypothetical protein
MFPRIAAADPAGAERWAELLFGPGTPVELRRVAFETYVVSWRYNTRTAAALAPAYDTALADLEAGIQPSWGAALGQHLIIADLTGLAGARDRRWVGRWYAHVPDEQRGQGTRLLADVAASAANGVRSRARDLLRWRVEVADAAPGRRELEEVTWASASTWEPGEVLASIVLPALERTGGRALDAPGVATLIARQARLQPDVAARSLRLLVDGDEYLAIAHLAGGQLREALSALLGADPGIAAQARQIINDLGARGALQFRDLLGE